MCVCVCVCGVCVWIHIYYVNAVFSIYYIKNMYLLHTLITIFFLFFPFRTVHWVPHKFWNKISCIQSCPWRYKLYTINFSERCYLHNSKKCVKINKLSHKNVRGQVCMFYFLEPGFVIKLLHAILTEQFTKYTLKHYMISKSCFSITLQFFNWFWYYFHK